MSLMFKKDTTQHETMRTVEESGMPSINPYFFFTAIAMYFHNAEIFKWQSDTQATWEVSFWMLILWGNTQER